jgi:hypothetical protein
MKNKFNHLEEYSQYPQPVFEPLLSEEHDSPLAETVVQEIKDCLNQGYVDGLDELLRFVPRIHLIQYLDEEQWEKFATEEELKKIYG